MRGRRTKVKVSLNGVDISSDVSGDTLSLTFTDSAEEHADNVDFQIQNREKKWLKGWFPEKRDTLSQTAEHWIAVPFCWMMWECPGDR